MELYQQATSGIDAAIRNKIKKDQKSVQANPYKETPVTVRVAKTLNPDEIAYRRQRFPKVQKALEKLLDRPLAGKKIPEIAVVLSGGGYRSMLYCSGFLTAADEEGLFDTLMYQVSLSGSTWGVAYLTQEYLKGKSVKVASDNLPAKIEKHLADTTPQELQYITDALLVKAAFQQPITTVDLFGLLLGNRLFNHYGDKRHQVYLSDQKDAIARGSWPFPIYTCVPAETTRLEKIAYEFTPVEVWAPWGMSVPPYAFGNRFENGVRQKNGDLFAPEQPMGILLGTFGSAYAFTLKRAYVDIEKKLGSILQPIISQLPKSFGQKRVASSDYLNFTAGISGSPIKNNRMMTMADGGLGISNLPIQPVSGDDNRRKQDIYIFVDVSETTNDASEMKKVADYMQSKGHKFPQIDNFKGIDRTTINVFESDDPTVPTVIYMPRFKELTVWEENKTKLTFRRYIPFLENFDIDRCVAQEGCASFDLQYKKETALKVQKLGEFNVHASIEVIKQAINNKIDRMSPTPVQP
jgi:predicted acylesterase/phospholipase RssA